MNHEIESNCEYEAHNVLKLEKISEELLASCVITSRAVGLALTVSLVHLAFYTSNIYIYFLSTQWPQRCFIYASIDSFVFFFKDWIEANKTDDLTVVISSNPNKFENKILGLKRKTQD